MWTTEQAQAAVDELVREDDYSPEEARQRIVELLRLRKPVRAVPIGWQGEVCCRCGRHNAVGFSVPDNVWAAVMGVTEEVVCLACFDAEAAVIGLAWEDSVEPYPCSTAGWASTS